MNDFIRKLDKKIIDKRKMTSPLYQIILEGKATKKLLQNFVIHRYPIKNFWTRNLMGIAARISDYKMRQSFVENIYEEETGALTNSSRHLNTFINFGKTLGLSERQITEAEIAEETQNVIEHNVSACNSSEIHFTAGVASVVLLMEGQPAIINSKGHSMERVMRESYMLPQSGYEFFTHHASSEESMDSVSDLEDEHAAAARSLLSDYCTTPKLQEQAMEYLDKALHLRHKHFDMILEKHYDPNDEVFRYGQSVVVSELLQ